MNRSALHPLLIVLTLSAIWPSRAAAQAIVVEVDNDARIPAADPARLVYIFVPRIVDASVKFAHDYTHILGLVVAHELGHVLLPAGSHSDTGVMKGGANLWGKIAHEFTARGGRGHTSRPRPTA
jgi:hypothetical protein